MRGIQRVLRACSTDEAVQSPWLSTGRAGTIAPRKWSTPGAIRTLDGVLSEGMSSERL